MPANRVPVSSQNPRWKVASLSALLALPFVLGYFFPDGWWTAHFLAFLPKGAGVFLLLLSAIFFSSPLWDRNGLLFKLITALQKLPLGPVAASAGIAVLFGVVVAMFPLYFDHFGDAPTILPAFEGPDSQVDHWALFLSPNVFHPRTGEITVTNLAAIICDTTGTDAKGAFRLIGAVSAALYAFICMLAVRRYLQPGALRFLVALAFLATPSALVFMGHAEVYAPLWPILALFCLLLMRFFERETPITLLWMLPVLLLALKFHITSILLIPVLLLGLAHHFLKQREGYRKRLNWKWMGLAVMLPLLLVAMVVYFGIVGDHRDPRFLGEGVSSFDRLFLPLFSPDPPLDRYNLFSPYHLADFLNLLPLWSPLGIVLVLAAGWLLRGVARWNAPETMGLGLMLVMYAGLLFLVNPLLGMPFDWDLMAIPAPFVGFFALALLRDSGESPFWKQMAGPAIGLLVLVLPMLHVHSTPEGLSQRLESLGRHTFRSYWIRSAGDIQAGLALIEDDPKLYEERYAYSLEALEPSALPGKDLEYAVLAAGLGKHYRKDQKDIPAAERYHRLAYQYYPDLDFNLIGLVECAYFKGDFKSALPYCEGLIRLQYPDLPKALSIGAELALRAGDMEKAKKWVGEYLKIRPQDVAFQELDHGLRQGLGPEGLLKVFGR